MAAVEQHDRHAGCSRRCSLAVSGASEIASRPSISTARRERPEEVAPLRGTLDVVQDQLIARFRQRVRHTPQSLDHRRLGEERRDDTDRVRASRRERARGGLGW